MPSSPFQGTQGSPTDIAIRYRLADGTLAPPICVATPNEPTLNKGIEITKIMAPGPTGKMGVVDLYPDSQDPSLAISFPVSNPITRGISEGKAPEALTTQADTVVVWGPRLITKQFYPPAIEGQEGFGILASPPGASGGTLAESGIIAPLTMTGVYSATVPPTGTKTVAIGANMALAFSADLIDSYVTMVIPNNLTGIIRLSEINTLQRCQIHLCGQTRNQMRWRLFIPEALHNPAEGGSIALNAEQKVDVNYTILTAGQCEPYQWEWLPQRRICV